MWRIRLETGTVRDQRIFASRDVGVCAEGLGAWLDEDETGGAGDGTGLTFLGLKKGAVENTEDID